MISRPGPLRAIRLLLVPLLLALGSCWDGPFARLNPYDDAAELAVRIAGGSDTLDAAGVWVIYQLVTEPATTGVDVAWVSSDPDLVVSQGQGLFFVNRLPETVTTILIRARIGAHLAERPVTMLPPP
jgi:hypothetical protein